MISTQDAPGCTQHGICSEEPSDIDSDHEDYEEAMEAGQTSGPRSRCKDTSGGTTIPDLNSTPQQYPSHHHGNNEAQVIRKGYHADLMLRSYNRNVLRPVYLSKDVYRAVFKSLPIEVSLAVVVDGQPVAEPPQNLKGKIVKCERRKPNFSFTVNLYFSESLDAHKYAGHRLSYYTAESGGPAGPKLTLYLKSPAVQQQEEETEWVTHTCRKGTQRSSSTHQRIQLSWNYVLKAFPDAQHDGMNLQLVLFKDDVQVEGVDGSSTLSQCGSYFQVLISESANTALLGSRLWQVRAKPPNLLKVYCIGRADDEQLPRGGNQTALPSTAATTAAVPAVASADPAPRQVPQSLQNCAQQPHDVRPVQRKAAAADQLMYHSQQQSGAHHLKSTQMHDKHRYSQPADSQHLAAAVAEEASHQIAAKRSSQALGGSSAATAAARRDSAAAAVQSVVLLEDSTQPQLTKRLRLTNPFIRATVGVVPKQRRSNLPAVAAAAVVTQGQLQTAAPKVDATINARRVGKSAVDIPDVAALPDHSSLRVQLEFKNEEAVGVMTNHAASAAATGASAPAQPLTYAAKNAVPAAQPKLPATQVPAAVSMPVQAQRGSTPAIAAETDVILILDSDSDDDNEPPAAEQQQQQSALVLQQRHQQSEQPKHQPGVPPVDPQADQHALPVGVLPAAPTTAGPNGDSGTQQVPQPEDKPIATPAAHDQVVTQAAIQAQTAAEAPAPAVSTVPASAVVQTTAAGGMATPAAGIESSSAAVAAPQTAGIAAPVAAPTATPAAAAAPSTTILPTDFTLSDSHDSNILSAGRQLTNLLDHLHAPDDQVMQLNDYIISLSHQSGDDNRVVRFWYDYSQIRLWVRRRNEQQCRVILHQMLDSYSR